MKYIIITTLLVVCAHTFGQQTAQLDSALTKGNFSITRPDTAYVVGERAVEGANQVSVFLGGGLSSFKYKPEIGNHKNGLGYTLGIDYSYYWHPKWGITTGFIFDRYTSSTNLEQEKVVEENIIDLNGDYVHLITQFNELNEYQKSTLISIPIEFRFRVPLDKRSGLIFGLGPKFAWSLTSFTQVSSGSFTTSHYDPYDHSTTPEPGAPDIFGDIGLTTYYPRDKSKTKIGFGISALADAAYYYKINRLFTLYGGPYFEYQLNKTKEGEDLPLVEYNIVSTNPASAYSSYNSVTKTDSYDGAKRLAVGLKVGLIFDIGSGRNVRFAKLDDEKHKAALEAAALWDKEKARQDSINAAMALEKANADAALKALAIAEAIRLAEEARVKDSIMQANSRAQVAEVIMDVRTDKLSDDELDVLKLPIGFQKDKSDLVGQSKINAGKVAEVLSKHPELKIRITGHTCDLGAEAYNQQLGLRRAVTLFKEFVAGGVLSSNVTTKSKGELEPLVPNTQESNRQKNRRVHVIIEDKE